MKMNKTGKGAGTTVALWVFGILAVAALLAMAWGSLSQTGFGKSEDEKNTNNELLGKAATLSVNARDKSADDTTTRRLVPIYVEDEDGEFPVSGTVSSATAATDLTSGITVGKTYKVSAFNNSFGMVGEPVSKFVNDERETVDVEVYTVAPTVSLTLYNQDDVALSTVTANMTLSAGETQSFSKLRIKNNQTNTGFDVYGIYIDTDANTNVSGISINDGAVDSRGSMSLNSVTTDDFNWKLKSHKLLYEFDVLDVQGIAVQADGDGTSGEAYTLYVADAVHFYSSQNKGVLYGPENDASSPSGVGATNPSVTGFFL